MIVYGSGGDDIIFETLIDDSLWVATTFFETRSFPLFPLDVIQFLESSS